MWVLLSRRAKKELATLLSQQIKEGWNTPTTISARDKLLRSSKRPGYYINLTEKELAEVVRALGDLLTDYRWTSLDLSALRKALLDRL